MSTRPRILVVEDEKSHQMIITHALGKNFDLILASNIREATGMLLEAPFDLFLLDIMLPDGDGFSFCQHIRSQSRYKFTPIVFLTSKQDVDSKVHGFALGGDDYLVKPCEPKELMARVEARIRRSEERDNAPEIISSHDLSLDLEKQRVRVTGTAEGDASIDLTPLEFKLLLHFVRHEDQAISRENILNEVWGQQTHVLERSVDTYVAALRRKLGLRGKYIRSVHGVGYRYSPASLSIKRAA